MNTKAFILAACTALACLAGLPAIAHDSGETVTPSLSRPIPNIPGKSLVAVVVDYAPGGTSLPHVHAGSAFVYAYVVSGAIKPQVNDEPAHIYRAGESFVELPGAQHRISRNASRIIPARLLAVFVVDTGDQNLTIPITQGE